MDRYGGEEEEEEEGEKHEDKSQEEKSLIPSHFSERSNSCCLLVKPCRSGVFTLLATTLIFLSSRKNIYIMVALLAYIAHFSL
jgi:hypothetical protein